VASIAAENRFPIEALPHSGNAKVPDDIKGRMILSQDAEGNVFDDMEPIEMEDLPKRIEARMADPNNPVKKVLIRADERVRYKDSKKVMMACGEAGMVDLIYTAFEK
jgi:biopolymer transport protein ExbD